MFNFLIKLILILLLIFTPIAFGSVELWAFSINGARHSFNHHSLGHSILNLYPP